MTLDYPDRLTLAAEQVQLRYDRRGMLTDSDLLDAAELWTTDDLDTTWHCRDLEALVDDLYRVFTDEDEGVEL